MIFRNSKIHNLKRRYLVGFLTVALWSLGALHTKSFAAPDVSLRHPLSYTQWKNLQIHEAEVNSMEIQKNLNSRKAEVKKSFMKLEYTKNLSIKDYFSVYLIQYKDNKGALKRVSKKFTKESTEELIKSTLTNL